MTFSNFAITDKKTNSKEYFLFTLANSQVSLLCNFYLPFHIILPNYTKYSAIIVETGNSDIDLVLLSR